MPTIVCGNAIGEYSFIGAGSVVTKDVPAYTVWYGNPAYMKGYVSNDGTRFSDKKENVVD